MKIWKELLGWGSEALDELRVIAFSYMRQGAFDLAKDLLGMLIVVDPGNIYDMKLLGAIYLEQGDASEALRWLVKAARQDPADLANLLNLCKAQLELGQLENGLKLAQKLSRSSSLQIAADAQALVMAYRSSRSEALAS